MEEFVDEPGQSPLHCRGFYNPVCFIQITASATEKDVKKALPIDIALILYVQDNDSEFLAAERPVTKPVSCSEYNYNQVKMLESQGSIYVNT